MATLLKKPPIAKVMKGIPKPRLNKGFTDEELAAISRHVLEWQAKASALGLTESEIEDIREDHRNSNEVQKIAMLRKWAQKYGDKATLRELILISRKNKWKKFIHQVCRELGYGLKEDPGVKSVPQLILHSTKKHYILILILLISLVLIGMGLWRHRSSLTYSELHDLPPPIRKFVGRQEEIEGVIQLLQYNSEAPQIVSITGPPGYGKSTLAIHIGHKMISDGVTIVYVDMEPLSSTHALALTILSNDETSTKNITLKDLYQWSKVLKKKTLLILDNCDKQLYFNQERFQRLIKNLIKNSKFTFLKILTTSRQQIMYPVKHKLYPITELATSYACELLLDLASSLDHNLCREIVNLTGGAPLALHVVGALMSMPYAPHPNDIIAQLKERLIETLSPEGLPTEDRVNVSIYLSYQHLKNDTQNAGRFLSYFPGSFDKKAACKIILESIQINDCDKNLEILVQRSLLDYDHRTYRYMYHKLIKVFFKDVSTASESTAFHKTFMNYYISVLENLDFKGPFVTLNLEQHNINYLFDWLNGISEYEKRIADIIMKIADTIDSSLNRPGNIFSSTLSDLKNYIKTIIAYLTQTRVQMIKMYGKKRFIHVYSKMIMHLVKIEQLIIRDIHTISLLKNMQIYRTVFEKYKHLISTRLYTTFFSTLASYYEKTGNKEQAKVCYDKVLRRHNELHDCDPGNCSNIQMAEAYFHLKDYKKSIQYYEMEFNANIEPISKAEILKKLYDIYSLLQDDHGIDMITGRLVEIVDSLMGELPVSIIRNGRTIIKISEILESRNQYTSSLKLDEYFTTCVHEATIHEIEPMIQLMIKMFREYMNGNIIKDTRKSIITVFLGKSILNLIRQTGVGKEIRPNMLYIIGITQFESGEWKESYFYLSEFLKYSKSFTWAEYDACNYIILMGSRECIALLPKLLWYHLTYEKHSHSVIPIPSPDYGSDFLSSDLIPVTSSALTVYEQKTSSFNKYSSKDRIRVLFDGVISWIAGSNLKYFLILYHFVTIFYGCVYPKYYKEQVLCLIFIILLSQCIIVVPFLIWFFLIFFYMMIIKPREIFANSLFITILLYIIITIF